MSQADLSHFTEEPDAEPDADPQDTHERDAIRQQTPTSADPGRQCGNCGSHVTDRFMRVLGPEDGQPKACPECASVAALRGGAGVHGDSDGRAEDIQQPTTQAKRAYKPRGIRR